MPTHPDAPGALLHFTGRTRGPGEIPPFAGVSPDYRLSNILQEGFLRAAPTFGTLGPVVCFSELSDLALNAVLRTGLNDRGPYEPWGLILRRVSLVRWGAGPVWYMTDSQYTVSNGSLPPTMLDRRVRSNPEGRPDWTHEREWRICWGDQARPGEIVGVPLDRDSIVGVMVGCHGWRPEWRWGWNQTVPVPPWCFEVRRWLWNGEQLLNDGTLRS